MVLYNLFALNGSKRKTTKDLENRKKDSLVKEEIEYDGAVIFCFDPNPDPEKAGLWKDIKLLLIPRHERWVPFGWLGAPLALAHPTFLRIEFDFLMKQIEFARRYKRFKPGRRDKFMIVSHSCAYYVEVSEAAHREFTIDDMMQDVATGMAQLRSHFHGADVSGFFKKPQRAGFVSIT